ncbi:MAG: cohesin domain-containing protein, partial [Phycisphaerae bacterium]
MMRFKAEGLIPIVVAALAVALTPPRASAINDLSLNVAPASLTAMPGDPVTVTLDVANLPQAINGFQVLLRYDPALLRLDSIVPTDLGLAPPNAGWVEVHFSEVFGDVTYAATINGGQIVLNHTAATLNFTALAEGVTSVVFRLDSPPFFTKLTAGVDNTTILPNKFDSSLITLSCDDGLFCNGAETFSAGLCQPGTDPCDDGVVCTDDTCNEALDTCTS